VNVDRIAARELEHAGSIASGLDLSEIGMDGHGVANRLWRIAAFLRQRAAREDREALQRAEADRP
jgi:hypothetical protein